MYTTISLTVESMLNFVKNGETHFVVHGHVAMTGDQVEHIISTGPLDLPSCAVLARAKPGEHLSITYMDVEDVDQIFRRYSTVAIEKREPVESLLTPRAPSIMLPVEPQIAPLVPSGSLFGTPTPMAVPFGEPILASLDDPIPAASTRAKSTELPPIPVPPSAFGDSSPQ